MPEKIVGFISGGHFTSDPTEFLVEGKVAAESTEEGYSYTVVDEKFVAEIGEEKYSTLEKALADVENDEIIKLLEDIELTEKVVIDNGKNIELDLNGNELTTTASIMFEITNGTVTLVDSAEEKGKVHAPNDVFYVFGGETKGKLVIEEGVVVKSDNDCCVVLKKKEQH